MEYQGGIGLELYVATPESYDPQQSMDSELLSLSLKGHNLEGRIEVIRLDGLFWNQDFFDAINVSMEGSKLPFLVITYNDETGIVLGYSGLEEVTDALNKLYSWEPTKFDVETKVTSTYYPNQQH